MESFNVLYRTLVGQTVFSIGFAQKVTLARGRQVQNRERYRPDRTLSAVGLAASFKPLGFELSP